MGQRACARGSDLDHRSARKRAGLRLDSLQNGKYAQRDQDEHRDRYTPPVPGDPVNVTLHITTGLRGIIVLIVPSGIWKFQAIVD